MEKLNGRGNDDYDNVTSQKQIHNRQSSSNSQQQKSVLKKSNRNNNNTTTATNATCCSSQDKLPQKINTPVSVSASSETNPSKRRNSNHSTASSSENSTQEATINKTAKNKERKQRARNEKKSKGVGGGAHQKPEISKQPLDNQISCETIMDNDSNKEKSGSHTKYENISTSDSSTTSQNENENVVEDLNDQKPKRKFKNAAERIRFVRSYQKKLKTEMCKNWEMHGTCKWLDKCSFAHGAHELSKKKHLPRNFKSKICEQFHKTEIGFCAYGNRCQFLHSQYNILQQDVEQQFSYTIQLIENARISKQRFQQIELSDELIYVNVFSNEHQQQSKRLSAFENITSSSDDDAIEQ